MQSLDLPVEKIVKCFHCGNETLMKRVGKSKWGSNDDFCFSYEYKMYECPVCHKVTLEEEYGDETMMAYTGPNSWEYYTKTHTIYPISSLESKTIPKIIKEAFESALKTKSIDSAVCLIALRRTLELCLTDKGATKWGLRNKIEEIAQKGLLPDTLKEASSLTKILGDTAAHGKEDIDVDEYDVDSMIGFVEYIIEYLYVIPCKLEEYKTRFDEKKSKKQQQKEGQQ